MAITNITRDWSDVPSMVRIVTTDNLLTITANGYLTAQAANIAAIQNAPVSNPFGWLSTDLALVSYNGGIGFFTIDSTVNNTFIPLQTSPTIHQQATFTLSSAQIQGSYATPTLIIPAQGAHTLILMGNINGEYVFGTTQYTAGGAAGLQYGNTAHRAGVAASSTIAAATINGYTANNNFLLTPVAAGLEANMVNLGIYWSNDTAAFATGDGTINLNFTYRVIKTTS